MTKIDPSTEIQRLRTLYGRMEDSELSELAAEAYTLTDLARQVLTDELRRRSMEPPPALIPTETKSVRDLNAPEPVMIRRYRDVPIAALAKTAPDSAGIECFLVDENLVRIDWFYSNAIGGVKLLVRAEDAAEALQVLDDVVPENQEEEPLE